MSVSGPSGCGKSTFLSVLALLETPTAVANGSTAAQRGYPRPNETGAELDIGLIWPELHLIGDCRSTKTWIPVRFGAV